MLLNYGVGEDSWESLGLQGVQPVHSEGDQSWDFFGRNDAKAETPVLWPPHAKSWLTEKDWCWQGLRAGGEGDDRGWDGWIASLTRWTWVSVNSGRWWCTGRPGMLRFMGSQTVGHDWATELNWTELIVIVKMTITRSSRDSVIQTLWLLMQCVTPSSSDPYVYFTFMFCLHPWW